MNGPRFVVVKRDPVYWHVLDRWRDTLDVIAFPLGDRTGVAHTRATLTAEYAQRRPEVLPYVEGSLDAELRRAGYAMPRRRPFLP